MSKNFFKKIKESYYSNKNNDRLSDFEKAKDILFSSKNLPQLVLAVRYINNFNKKHGITEQSPEFIYFKKMIRLMRHKLRDKDTGDDKIDESYRINRGLKNIIKESLDDFDWIRSTKSGFDPNFEFENFEYWIDLSTLTNDETTVVGDYILKVLPNIRGLLNVSIFYDM